VQWTKLLGSLREAFDGFNANIPITKSFVILHENNNNGILLHRSGFVSLFWNMLRTVGNQHVLQSTLTSEEEEMSWLLTFLMVTKPNCPTKPAQHELVRRSNHRKIFLKHRYKAHHNDKQRIHVDIANVILEFFSKAQMVRWVGFFHPSKFHCCPKQYTCVGI